MLVGDIESMNAYMNRISRCIFSYFNVGRKSTHMSEPERFYHGFVLGLLVELIDRYEIKSNRESGFGRYDVMLRPRNVEKDKAIIMEFKEISPKKEKSLEETAQNALKQIKERYKIMEQQQPEKQKVAEEVWEPPVEIENSEAETEEAENAETSTESAYWFIPQASDDLLTEEEKEQLQSTVLSAAESVREIYKDIVIADALSYSSGISEFTKEQRKAVVEQLGRNGLVSVEEDTAMQNHEAIEAFYADYLDGQDSMVTVFEVQRDGLIGAVTFIYRKGELQTYYIGIRWREGGMPEIQGTSVSNVAEIKLTEKGYFIYAYEYVIAHASLRQYWRIEPLPEDCQELTEKYISGLSYVNYNLLVTDWDSSNVEDILMPCMYEDVYRISTGENLKTEGWKIPDIGKNLTKHTGELTNANLKNMMQEVASNLTEYQKGNYILTDDQAPVELLGMQVIDELIKDEVQYYKDIYKERGIKGLMESL